MIRTIILLTAIVVYIIDISGFTQSWHGLLQRWLKVSRVQVKPFDCSTCMSFWVVLVYSLCSGVVLIHSLGLAVLASFLAYPMAVAMDVMRDFLFMTLGLIQKFINYVKIQ